MPGSALLLAAALAALAAGGLPARAGTPADFVRETSAGVFSSAGEDASDAERSARLRGLLDEAFDLPRIARFVLGRHWRAATDAQRTEFVALFRKFVVRTYAKRFRELAGKRLTVLRAREISPGLAVVDSEISSRSEAPVKVDWHVAGESPDFRVVDVKVEGISMSVTQRDEFAAVIKRRKLEGLLRALRRKTSSRP